ncbi:UNKNOWN [Stylonychia lemnae]|uniref:Secreted protein n=1 Tax=Stylonychia lemnae TaxID=5949 RepID=A0A078AK47_STYLE|nr:UNKNOWN [Stylonychia lemnae]|eukprot:CDW82271.1 UNKNOWN [Stylonychia lemnae]
MQKSLLLISLICATTVSAGLFSKKKVAAPVQLKAVPAVLTEAIQFIDGLGVGIIKEDIGADLQRCYSGAGDLKHDITHAIQDFEIGGILGYISGALRIIKLIKELPTSFSGCKDAGAGLKKFVGWAETQFADISALESKMATNFLWNSKTVIGDAEDGITQAKAGDYYDSGLDIGKAVSILTQ